MNSYSERNKQIVDYLNSKMDEIDKEYPQINVRSRAAKALDNVLESPGSFDEVKEKLDKTFDKMIEVFKEKEDERRSQEISARNFFDIQMESRNVVSYPNKFFGETFKTPLIDIFEKYDEVINNPNIENKGAAFDHEFKNLLFVLKQKYKASISSQIKDDIMRGEWNGKKEDPLLFVSSDLFRGIDALTFDSIKNLYEIFLNDLNIISSDFDNSMKFCVNGSETPYVLTDNKYYSNDAYFDFRRLVHLFEFGKKHGKKLRLHYLIHDDYVPEDLISNVSNMNEEEKREYTLSFLDDYISHLSKELEDRQIVLDQIDVIGNIGLDNDRHFWLDTLGDTYYVDVFKIVRKYFYNSMLCIQVDDECIDLVCSKACNMIRNIQTIEKSEGIHLIDGIGVSSHITEFMEYYGRELSGKDMYDTMMQYCSFGLPIIRTEFDYKLMDETNLAYKPEFLKTMEYIDTRCGICGYILCGNSDTLTNQKGEFNHVHLVNQKGLPKKEYDSIRDKYLNKVTVSSNSSDNNTTGTVIKYSTDNRGSINALFTLFVVLFILIGFIVSALFLAS